MKRETYDRPLSESTMAALRRLLADLFNDPDRNTDDALCFYSVGMVLASPKVGVLAAAEPARKALREEVMYLKMVVNNAHIRGPHRDDALCAMKEISGDLDFGRRN